MTLEKLQIEMISAMKSHDKARKEVISSLVSAVKKAAIDKKCKDNITEELVNEVILKEKKTVQEMIDSCPEERNELLELYKFNLSIINEFAPQLMTDEKEIESMVIELLRVAGVEMIKSNKGQIMKIVMPEMKGKADMKIVNQVIGNLLK